MTGFPGAAGRTGPPGPSVSTSQQTYLHLHLPKGLAFRRKLEKKLSKQIINIC